MRALILIACLALSTDALAAPALEMVPGHDQASRGLKPLPVHVGGRALASRGDRGSTRWLQAWPGGYYEAAYTGGDVVLRFDDAWNEYRLLIDDEAPIPIVRPGRAEARITGITPGAHRLRLERVTEGAPGTFGGFFVARDAKPGTVAQRTRQIEYIGDSSMTGYGARSPKRQCTPLEVDRQSDTQNAYPALVAKHFDADYQVNAKSGVGLIRSYGGATDRTMTVLYPRTVRDNEVRTVDPKWKPQLMVIRLVADFTGSIGPNEKWRDFGALGRDYVAAMGSFVEQIARRYPRTAIAIWWLDFSGVQQPGFWRMMADGQAQIRARALAAGARQVEFPVESNAGLSFSACHNHMSLADHRVMTQRMIDFIAAHPGLLPAAGAS